MFQITKKKSAMRDNPPSYAPVISIRGVRGGGSKIFVEENSAEELGFKVMNDTKSFAAEGCKIQKVEVS